MAEAGQQMQVGHNSLWMAGSHLPIHRRGHDIKQEDEKDPSAWLCSSDSCSIAMDATLLTFWWWQIFQERCKKCVYLVFFSLHKRKKPTCTSASPGSVAETDVKGRFALKHWVCGGIAEVLVCELSSIPCRTLLQRGEAPVSYRGWSGAPIGWRSNWILVWKGLFMGPLAKWVYKGHRCTWGCSSSRWIVQEK